MKQYLTWAYQKNTHTLALEYAEKSILGDHEILVKNQSIGINPVDWKLINANPLNWENGHVPGVDGAGIVVEVGAKVSRDMLDKKVAYHAALKKHGSFAEYTVLNAERVMVLPDTLSFEQAAALPCPMLTAWQAFEKIPSTKLKDVLIVGFGAVNNLLTQMLTQANYNVDVVSASLSQEQANKMGIRQLYRNQVQVNKKYFALFDAVSGMNAATLVSLLRPNGHVICIQDRINAPIDPAFTKTISYHEIALGALHDFGDSEDWQALIQNGENLLMQIAERKIQIPDPVCFKFDQMPDALKNSENTKLKTVVTLSYS